MSPQVGPSLRRRQLAEQLTLLRGEAGLGTAQVGEHLRVDRSLVSHYEAGRRLPKYAELVMMLQLYGASDRLEVLGELLERANDRGWWQTVGLPPWIQPYLGLEADATRVRCWALELVPGLIQTASYAEVVFQRQRTEHELVAKLLDVRKRRQQQATVRGTQVELAFSEALVHRTASMPGCGLDQLRLLVDSPPHFTVRVLPFEEGGHCCMSGSYTLLDFPSNVSQTIGYREGASHGDLTDDLRSVQTLEQVWDDQMSMSLSSEESVEFMKEILTRYQ